MVHRELVDVSVEDAVRGLGLGDRHPLHRPAAALLRRFGRGFAEIITEMDARIGRSGMVAGADEILGRFSGPVSYSHLARIPAEGPLVVVANHPGTVDTLALWRALAVRDRDLRVIALDRRFLRLVPNLAARLLYVEEHASQRTGLVRLAAAHLRTGGAVLTFPAGDIEPDPGRRLADAVAALEAWSASPELLARLVPGTVVLPIAVSGVISARMRRHPLARWQPTSDDRDTAAATLQVMFRDRTIRPRLIVGDPLTGDPHGLQGRLREAMATLLAEAAAPTEARPRP